MKVLFWTSLVLVAYAYLAYPVLLLVLSSLVRQSRKRDEGSLPFVTMLVAAYNEEKVIADKVRNFQELDYPNELIELVVGTDGCTDRTNELLKTVEDERVRYIPFPVRRGKASVLNDLVKEARGEILVFSDANTMYARDAVRRLVSHFVDPRVGGVCGRLELVAPSSERGSWGEAAYWSFENFLKKLEGQIKTVVGANGAIYALRRDLYSPLPTDKVIMDDFLIPLRAVLKGYDVLYDQDARAQETVAPDVRGEFWRKVRIGAANFNALKEIAPLLNPRRGFVAFALWSHKIVRWLIPFALVLALVSNAFLLGESLYRATFAAQLVFYGLAAAGLVADRRGRVPKILLFPLTFVSANLGLLLGFFRFVTGTQKPAWARIERASAS